MMFVAFFTVCWLGACGPAQADPTPLELSFDCNLYAARRAEELARMAAPRMAGAVVHWECRRLPTV